MPWYARPLMLACMITLPIVVTLLLIGKLPYSYYRRKFDEPEFVQILRAWVAIGLMGILWLGGKLYEAIKPKTVHEQFMIGPPFFSNIIFPTAAFASYSFGAPNLALGLIAALLLHWMTFLPYKAGFRLAIRIVDSKEFASRPRGQNAEYPTGKTLFANAIGILICGGTLGYLAGGVVGAMQTMIIVFSILASAGAWLFGMVHGIYVYGPYQHDTARSSAHMSAHFALADQGNPFYCDDVDENDEMESPRPEESDDCSKST